MTFKLQPGDYILTSEIPFDKRQLVIDAFVAAGAKTPVNWWHSIDDANFVDWDINDNEVDFFEGWPPSGYRHVTLSQILSYGPSWSEIEQKDALITELVGALEEVHKSIVRLPDGFLGYHQVDDVYSGEPAYEYPAKDELIGQISAALAKAKAARDAISKAKGAIAKAEGWT
jgi:hypothetical protein